jgi:6-phosphogluconolactonase
MDIRSAAAHARSGEKAGRLPALRGSVGRRGLLAAAGTGVLAGLAAVVHARGDGGPAAPPVAAPPTPGGSGSHQAAAGQTAARARPASGHVYLGTYTSSGGGKGVGAATYDTRSGAISPGSVLTGVANPSFLALAPGGGVLYAVDEQDQGEVTAAAVAPDGSLRRLGARATGGSSPCHLTVHHGGRHVLSANYGSGSIAVHPLDAEGALLARSDLVQHTGSGPDPARQAGPHVHMVLNDIAGAFVLAVDLGTDSVYTYRLDPAAGRLTEVSRAAVTPGSGPRHLAFHPSGRFAYLANELGDSVIVCRYDPATGKVTPGRPQPTVPAGSRAAGRNYPAEVLVSADGAYVYVSNRGHDSVARFAVTRGGAALRLLDAVPSGGAYPRHIALDPAGTLLFAANQNSGTVTRFHVHHGTGALTPAGGAYATPTPVCVLPL